MSQYDELADETAEEVEAATVPLRRASQGQVEIVAQLVRTLTHAEVAVLIQRLKAQLVATENNQYQEDR